jgi:hypothetical protein
MSEERRGEMESEYAAKVSSFLSLSINKKGFDEFEEFSDIVWRTNESVVFQHILNHTQPLIKEINLIYKLIVVKLCCVLCQ